MGNLGEDTPKLGFGLMRLPKLEKDVIDVEQVKDMVDAFLAAGFTYFDTAWVYNGSEEAIRKALVDRHPRDCYTLATKCAAWSDCKSREDAIAQFETSLQRTGAGYFDFYLLHNLGQGRTHFYDDWDLWSYFMQKKEEGLIRHLGFSFHSTPEELEEILIRHPEAEFVQLQINYADWEHPVIQSKANYETARRYGKPVVIMEPVKGGNLASPPETVQALFKAAEPESSIASWAVRFAASLDGVITVLSGMSTLGQMQDNLSCMKGFTGLSDEQKAVIEKAREELGKLPLIPCTSCNYCAKVCPMEIGISGSFNALNLYLLYHNMNSVNNELQWQVDGQGRKRADQCIQCGQCEEVCPQHIPIRDELVRVTETLG